MKVVGLLLVTAAGTMCGGMARVRLKKRVTALTEVRTLLGRIRERVRYTSEPMAELLEQWGIPASRENEVDDRESWERNVVAWSKEHGLSNEDSVVLERFVRGFGFSDVEGAIRYCDEYRDVIRERLQDAQNELKTKGRVLMALGICGGLSMSLLLL
ncbi:MAG: stage III sporulation protein AB [Clostridia bacterium]|nr:stage III sporulation protein AB [Clostridia bacterium]